MARLIMALSAGRRALRPEARAPTVQLPPAARMRPRASAARFSRAPERAWLRAAADVRARRVEHSVRMAC
jgi:hypothetical protein